MNPRTLERWDAFAVSSGFKSLKDMLEKLVKRGLNAVDLSHELNCSRGRVLQLAREVDVGLVKPRVADEQDLPPKLRKLLLDRSPGEFVKMNAKVLAVELGIHPVTARRYLRQLRRIVLKGVKDG